MHKKTIWKITYGFTFQERRFPSFLRFGQWMFTQFTKFSKKYFNIIPKFTQFTKFSKKYFNVIPMFTQFTIFSRKRFFNGIPMFTKLTKFSKKHFNVIPRKVSLIHSTLMQLHCFFSSKWWYMYVVLILFRSIRVWIEMNDLDKDRDSSSYS